MNNNLILTLAAIISPILTIIIVYFVFIKRLLNQIDKQTEMINCKSSSEYQNFQLQKMKIQDSDDYKNLLYENQKLADRLKEIEDKRFIK